MRAENMAFMDPRARKAFIARIIILNLGILALALMGQFVSQIPALVGGWALVVFMSMRALVAPLRTFYLFFGIKFTYDILWFIRAPAIGPFSLRLLEIAFVPMLVLIFVSLGQRRDEAIWPRRVTLLYLLWTVLAPLLNGLTPDPELLIRQSGIFFGLLLGLRYLGSRDRLDFFMTVLFASTVVPLLASLAQFALGSVGISIFYGTMDSVRGMRLSGLYYDPATTGMMIIGSLLGNVYLLTAGEVAPRMRKYLLGFLLLSVFFVIVGETRSILIVTAILLAVFMWREFVRRPAAGLAMVPLLAGLLVIGRPYLDKTLERFGQEVRGEVVIGDVLAEDDYRGMFSGRMMLWQDIMARFRESEPFEQALGTGLSSNPHSSYFFLILQIGWLGLAYYLGMHAAMILTIWRRGLPGFMRVVGLLALGSFLLMGISATTVIYTSFQWLIYLIVGAALARDWDGED